MSKLRFYAIYVPLKALALLPFGVLYRISDLIYLVVKHVLHYRRAVILGNLRRSFPEKSEKEIADIADKYYRHLADLIVETVKLLHVSDKVMRKHVEVRNAEIVDDLTADGRPMVMFLGHYGNWEWAQEVSHYYKRPQVTCELYRPVRDTAMDDIMKRIRSRYHTTLIPQKKAVRQIIGMTNEGVLYIAGFIADQRPYSMKGKHHWTTFLNQDSAYVTGGEEIGRHVNAHFAYLDIEKPRRGHYVMTFKEMNVPDDDKDENPYSRLYLKMMEDTIRREPQYWLWSHNRWKYGRNGEKIH